MASSPDPACDYPKYWSNHLIQVAERGRALLGGLAGQPDAIAVVIESCSEILQQLWDDWGWFPRSLVEKVGEISAGLRVGWVSRTEVLAALEKIGRTPASLSNAPPAGHVAILVTAADGETGVWRIPLTGCGGSA